MYWPANNFLADTLSLASVPDHYVYRDEQGSFKHDDKGGPATYEKADAELKAAIQQLKIESAEAKTAFGSAKRKSETRSRRPCRQD